MAAATTSTLSHLECARCGTRAEADKVQTVCPKCQGPLFARYDLEKAKETLNPLSFGGRPATMWRYEELLPVRDVRFVTTLGEGSTPLLHLARLGESVGLKSLLLKDEGQNPTGTFKARGLAMAVSRNVELGLRRFAVPTAGNAGGALAAYAAAAGCQAFVAMPHDTPTAMKTEAKLAGAEVAFVDGSIADAAKLVQERVRADGWFDVSTMKEPYRLEGKKTMGFEIAEALGWTVPDVILYPTGGGIGLVGLWKAFSELEALDLIGSRRPRMVAVQAEGVAPVVKAFAEGQESCEPWPNPRTVANGLRVPKPFGDRETLRVIRESRGTALAVSDSNLLAAARELAAKEGILLAPEAAATVPALKLLRDQAWIESKETVVLLGTGSGLKYAELYAA